jgi:hypothetical protein
MTAVYSEINTESQKGGECLMKQPVKKSRAAGSRKTTDSFGVFPKFFALLCIALIVLSCTSCAFIDADNTFYQSIIHWNEVPSPEEFLSSGKFTIPIRVDSEKRLEQFSFNKRNLTLPEGATVIKNKDDAIDYAVTAVVEFAVSALFEAARANIQHEYQVSSIEGSDYPILVDTRKLASALLTDTYYTVTVEFESVFHVLNANKTSSYFLAFVASEATPYTPTQTAIETDQAMQLPFGDVRLEGAYFQTIDSNEYLVVYYQYSNTTTSEQSFDPRDVLPVNDDIALKSISLIFYRFLAEDLIAYSIEHDPMASFYFTMKFEPGESSLVGVAFGIEKPKQKSDVSLAFRNYDTAFNLIDAIDVPVYKNYDTFEKTIGELS